MLLIWRTGKKTSSLLQVGPPPRVCVWGRKHMHVKQKRNGARFSASNDSTIDLHQHEGQCLTYYYTLRPSFQVRMNNGLDNSSMCTVQNNHRVTRDTNCCYFSPIDKPVFDPLSAEQMSASYHRISINGLSSVNSAVLQSLEHWS